MKYKWTQSKIFGVEKFPEGWRICVDMGSAISLWMYVDEEPPFKKGDAVKMTVILEKQDAPTISTD